MAERLGEMDFRLYRREGYAMMEGVEQFKYLVSSLDPLHPIDILLYRRPFII